MKMSMKMRIPFMILESALKPALCFLGGKHLSQARIQKALRAAQSVAGDDTNSTTLRALRIQSVLRCEYYVLKAGKRKINRGSGSLYCKSYCAPSFRRLHQLV